MAKKAIQFTYDDYLLFPYDRNRHQIIEGEHYLTPSPALYHQDISRNLQRILVEFVEGHNLGKIYDAPVDVVLSDINVVVPDLVFVSTARASILLEKYIAGPPDLIVEILSESTKKIDRDLKLKLYAKFGVAEYWIVDPKGKTVIVHRLAEGGYSEAKSFAGSEELVSSTFPGLRVPLALVFRK
ncbi:MAG TPA: Uma2 family endonuclease [Acidobacteriota bacterium]|jgi:Uma2 family endonuclease